MKNPILVIFFWLGISGIALAENPPVETDSCRLYNAYYLDGNLVSDSQGIIYNDHYRQAASRDLCLNYCRKEEESRTEQVHQFNMPNYILKVECFYGNMSVYKKTIKAK